MSRWLGIDYGHKRIGIAVGDTGGAPAGPVCVIQAAPLEQALKQILELAEQYDVDGVVVGWPLNMDDSAGSQAHIARAVAGRLADMCQLDVRIWDERLSSFEADRLLAGKLTRAKRRARQDALAAAVMLGDFLAAGGPKVAARPGETGGSGN